VKKRCDSSVESGSNDTHNLSSSEEAIEAIDSDIRTLLSPDESGNEFAMKYNTTLQRHPGVVLAHALHH
jgi:hypothetical protein